MEFVSNYSKTYLWINLTQCHSQIRLVVMIIEILVLGYGWALRLGDWNLGINLRYKWKREGKLLLKSFYFYVE